MFIEADEAAIQQCLALLAMGPRSNTYPYNWLYDQQRWVDISDQFESYTRALYGLPIRPQLVSLIHAGLSSLKTSQCDGESNNINCPVCTPPLASVAARLPFAHHETSILVCPLTGSIMDADNTPMALPNGNVYSLKVLEDMANKTSGNVVCYRTKQVFRLSEARKCYIS